MARGEPSEVLVGAAAAGGCVGHHNFAESNRNGAEIFGCPRQAGQKQRTPDDAGVPRVLCSCCFLLASLRRHLRVLGRRVHCQFVGAHVLEQDRAIRQIGLAQAGAGRRNRASYDRRSSSDRVVVTARRPADASDQCQGRCQQWLRTIGGSGTATGATNIQCRIVQMMTVAEVRVPVEARDDAGRDRGQDDGRCQDDDRCLDRRRRRRDRHGCWPPFHDGRASAAEETRVARPTTSAAAKAKSAVRLNIEGPLGLRHFGSM